MLGHNRCSTRGTRRDRPSDYRAERMKPLRRDAAHCAGLAVQSFRRQRCDRIDSGRARSRDEARGESGKRQHGGPHQKNTRLADGRLDERHIQWLGQPEREAYPHSKANEKQDEPLGHEEPDDASGTCAERQADANLPLAMGDTVYQQNIHATDRQRRGENPEERDESRHEPRTGGRSRHELFHFDADPSVLGRPITVAGKSVTIIGIAPRGFRGLSLAHDPAVYVPLETIADVGPSAYNFFGLPDHGSSPTAGITIIGRLPQGATAEQIAARLEGLFLADGRYSALTLVDIIRQPFRRLHATGCRGSRNCSRGRSHCSS